MEERRRERLKGVYDLAPRGGCESVGLWKGFGGLGWQPAVDDLTAWRLYLETMDSMSMRRAIASGEGASVWVTTIKYYLRDIYISDLLVRALV